MAKDVVMPVLGMSQDSGVLLKWLKQPGDAVTKGDILMEVETDKAVVEVEAQASGTLAQVSAAEGEEIPTGQVIAVILAEGESEAEAADASAPPTDSTTDSAPAAASSAPSSGGTTAVVDRPSETAVAPATEPAGGPPSPTPPVPSGPVRASPKAKRLAREQGVALASVAGRGPDRAVLAQDVLDYRPEDAAPVAPSHADTPPATDPAAAPSTAPAAAPSAALSAETAPLTSSFQSDTEVTALREFVEQINRRSSSPLTLSDVLLKLVLVALRKHPELRPDPDHTDIAVVAANGDRAVLPQADKFSLARLAEWRSGVSGADGGGSSPVTFYDLSGAAVDRVSNALGAGQRTALSVGRVYERFVPVAGAPTLRPHLTLTLSVSGDVSSAAAAAFLDSLTGLIDDPLDFIVAF